VQTFIYKIENINVFIEYKYIYTVKNKYIYTVKNKYIYTVKMNHSENELVIQTILDTNRPNLLTYFSIGAAARTTKLNQYIPRIQQIIPPCFDLTKPIRIISYDPLFKNQISFLDEYFENKNIRNHLIYRPCCNNYISINEDGMSLECNQCKYYCNKIKNDIIDDDTTIHKWSSDDNNIEITIVCKNFWYTQAHNQGQQNCDWVLETITNICLQTNTKLIVQDFSGSDTNFIFKHLYDDTMDKQHFKNNILFDFSYGHNHCDIDLIHFKPEYDHNENFANFLLMDTDEIEQIMNKYPIAKEIINNSTDKQYRKVIDIIPVDIRRIMLRDAGQSSLPLYGYKNLYTINTPIPEIMRILKKEVESFIIIYRRLNRLDSSKEDLLKELLINYQNYTLTSKPDIYWWSNQFVKILN